MPTGFPVPNMADGTGATPEDLQLVVASRYRNAGILEGTEVTGQTDMRYHVARGAVVVDLGPGLAAEVPVGEQYLTVNAGGTAARTDTIYVKQNLPATNGDNLAVVAVTSGAAPAGAVILDKRLVPAGATSTSATSSTHDRVYAILTGGSLGSLGYKADTDATPHLTETVRAGDVRLPALPTDRLVELTFTGTMSLSTSTGATPDTTLRASVIVRLYVDDKLRKSFELPVDRMWASRQFTTLETVTAGAGHTAHYTVTRKWVDPALPAGSAYWAVRAGGVDQYRGNTLALFDRGPVA